MASTKVSTTITFRSPGTQPPLFVAGSFSEPEWQPQEMECTTGADGEHVFTKEIWGEPGSKVVYKFRIGLGDWWVLDESAPTVTDGSGFRNNELEFQHPPKEECKSDLPKEEATSKENALQTNGTTQHQADAAEIKEEVKPESATEVEVSPEQDTITTTTVVSEIKDNQAHDVALKVEDVSTFKHPDAKDDTTTSKAHTETEAEAPSTTEATLKDEALSEEEGKTKTKDSTESNVAPVEVSTLAEAPSSTEQPSKEEDATPEEAKIETVTDVKEASSKEEAPAPETAPETEFAPKESVTTEEETTAEPTAEKDESKPQAITVVDAEDKKEAEVVEASPVEKTDVKESAPVEATDSVAPKAETTSEAEPILKEAIEPKEEVTPSKDIGHEKTALVSDSKDDAPLAETEKEDASKATEEEPVEEKPVEEKIKETSEEPAVEIGTKDTASQEETAHQDIQTDDETTQQTTQEDITQQTTAGESTQQTTQEDVTEDTPEAAVTKVAVDLKDVTTPHETDRREETQSNEPPKEDSVEKENTKEHVSEAAPEEPAAPEKVQDDESHPKSYAAVAHEANEAEATEAPQTDETAPAVEAAPVADETEADKSAVATEVAPVKEAAPAVDVAPAEKTAPVEEAAPVEKADPVSEETAPVAEAASAEETAPETSADVAEETDPAAENTPVEKTASAAEETAPTTESAHVEEAAPVEESARASKDAPAEVAPVEATPVAEELPAKEAASTDETAPAVDAAPVEEASSEKQAEPTPATYAEAVKEAPAEEPASIEDAAPVKEAEPVKEEVAETRAEEPEPVANAAKELLARSQPVSESQSGASTPSFVKTAAEVADSAALLDEGTPEDRVSDEEAGKTGFRRLSSTPIAEVSETAAEVADSANYLDAPAAEVADTAAEVADSAKSLDTEPTETDQSELPTPAEDGPHNPALFSHECAGMYGEEPSITIVSEDVDQDNAIREETPLDEETIDINDPTLERFPSNREEIIDTVRKLETGLEEDQVLIEDAPPSPIIGSSTRRESDVAHDAALGASVIPRTVKSLAVPHSPRISVSSAQSSALSLQSISESEEPASSKEDDASTVQLTPPHNSGTPTEATSRGAVEDEGISLSPDSPKKTEYTEDLTTKTLEPQARGIPEVSAHNAAVETTVEPTALEEQAPKDSKPTNGLLPSPEVVAETTERSKPSEPEAQQSTEEPTAASDATGSDGHDEAEASATATGADAENTNTVRKRGGQGTQASAPPANDGPVIKQDPKSGWFTTFCKLIIVDFLGGILSRIAGNRKKQTLLAAGTAAVAMGVGYWKLKANAAGSAVGE